MLKKNLSLFLLVLLCCYSARLHAQCPSCQVSSGELVINGDFAQGNNGFFSEYKGNTILGKTIEKTGHITLIR